MITVANRASPKPLTLEQQKNAVTSEALPSAAPLSEPAIGQPVHTAPIRRVTLHLHAAHQRGPAVDAVDGADADKA
jgi:hypothetical protein